MARIRSVKPDYWHDRKIARSCSRDARLFYIGLWNQADEHSRCNGDTAVLKGQIFPYDDIDIGPLLAELVIAGRVQPYLIDGDPFLFLPKLAEHQRLEPTKVASKFPDPPTEFPDPTTVFPDLHNGEPSVQVTGESEKICAESARNPRESSLLYVAGSMEHVKENPPTPLAGGKTSRRKPKTPAPEAFSITAEMREWAAEKAPHVDVDRQTERFLRSAKANDRRYANWYQAWQNWMTSDFNDNGHKRTTGLVAVWDA